MVVLTSPTTSTPSPPPLGTFIDNGALQLVDVLGYGGYGIVYRAISTYHLSNPSTSQHQEPISYAVKCLPHTSKRSPNSATATSRQRQLHLRETTLHSLVSNHPNIITLHRVISDPVSQYTFIIMDYAPSSDLFTQILHNRTYLNNNVLIKDVFLQMVEAVEHCHLMGVYHRDLKPENVLCFDDGRRIKITDFGLATTERWSREFKTGSVYHMSPECQGTSLSPSPNASTPSYSPPSSDIWSLGIILLNLITGRNPWKSACASTDPTFRAYLSNPDTFLMSVLPISHECNDVLSMPGGLLDLDGSRRGTFFSGASSAKKAGRVDWRAMKEHIRSIENFYAPDVVFESGMARCRWEVESGPHPEEEEEEEQHQAVVQSVAHSEVHSEVVSVHSVAHTEVTSPAIGRWADEADEHWQPSSTHDAHSETTSHWSASPVQSNVDSDMVFASPASPNGYDYYDDRHYGYGYAPVAYTATPSWTPNPMSSSSSRTTRSHSPDRDDETSYIRYEITRSQSAGSHAFPRRTLKDELDSVPSNSSGSETSSDEDELPSPPITPPAHQTLNRMTRMNLARLDTSVGMFNRRQLPSANPRTAVSGTQTLVSATQRNRELLSASREVLISSAVATVARGNYLDSAVRGSYMDYEEEMMLMRTAMDGYPSAVDGIPLWAITSPLETDSDKKEKDRQQQSPISRDLAPRSAQDSDIRMSTVSPQQQQKPETTDVMDYSYTYSEWSTYSDAQAFDVEKEDKEKSDPNRMSIVFDSMPMSAVQPEPEPYPFIDQQLRVAFPLPQDTAQSATYQPGSLGLGLSVAPVPIPVPAPAQDPNMVYTGLGDAYGYGGAFNFLNFTPPETTIAPATDNAHSNFMSTPNIVENHNDSLGGSFAMIDSPYSIPPSAPSFSLSTYQTEVVSAVSPGVGCGGFLFPHTPGVNSPAPVSPAPLPIRPPPSPATRAARTKSRTFRFPGSHHPHVPPSSAMLPNTNTSRSRMRVNGTTSRSRSRKARSSSRAPGTRTRTTSMSFLSSVLAFPRRSGSGSNSNDVPPVPSIPRRSEEREKTSALITAPKPPPPTPASCTPSGYASGSGSGSTGSSSSSISTTNADQMHGSLKAGTWTQSCSFGSGFRKEEAKTTGVVLGPTSPGASIGRRRRRRGPLDWLSPGKLFATIMPSSSS